MRRSIRVLTLLVLAVAACGSPPPSPSATAGDTPAPTGPVSSSASSSASPAAPSLAPGAAPALALSPVFDGLDSPVDIAYRPNEPTSLFVVEQGGRIRLVRDDKLLERPFLDIRDLVMAGGERGLLGLAFLPTAEEGRFFVYYTDRDGRQVVASYDTTATDPDAADPSTARIWLTMDDQFANHNGGSLAFGPDGMLYIGTGDGGGGGDPLDSGRHLDTLLAKVLRIDVSQDEGQGSTSRYRIPPDNPFVSRAGARPEIFATGLRNPWRLRFDRTTGDLWIGDVGQGAWEEIDVIRAGTSGFDFGWNTMEGSHCYRDSGSGCATPDLTLPVAEYGHDQGCSVTGGTVYRGSAFPALQGWYVFSDYCSGTFWAIDAATATSSDTIDPPVVATTNYSISAIAEDSAGELFATDLSSGALLRIGLGGS
jgi:glucose/arabinose dehydrogenase